MRSLILLPLLATLSPAGELPLVLHYDEPAKVWARDALPVGNGRLGAMVFGKVGEERIQLNEESLWAGPPVPELPDTFRDSFQKARKLWFDGEEAAAQALVQENMAPRISPRSHQTLGDLFIRMPAGDTAAENYRRELDLDRALATTTFTIDGVTHTREVFASHPDDVLVVRWTADKPGSVTGEIELSREDATIDVLDDSVLQIRGRANHKGNHKGVLYGATLLAIPDGGELKKGGDSSLQVSGADSLTLLLTACTDYNRTNPASPLETNPIKECGRIVSSLKSKPYEKLLADHIADFQQLFHRCRVHSLLPVRPLHADQFVPPRQPARQPAGDLERPDGGALEC